MVSAWLPSGFMILMVFTAGAVGTWPDVACATTNGAFIQNPPNTENTTARKLAAPSQLAANLFLTLRKGYLNPRGLNWFSRAWLSCNINKNCLIQAKHKAVRHAFRTSFFIC